MTGMTNVTLPVRSMRRKAFGANGELVVRVSRTSPRAGRPKPSSKPPPMALVAVRKLRREGEARSRVFTSHLRVGDAGGLLDGRTDTRIGTATADVAGHGIVDVRIARPGRRGEQRACRHDLARLAVAALRHVQRSPGRLDPLARRRGADGFDGGDLLGDGRRHRRDAGAGLLPVDLDRARAAKARAAAEFRAGHVQHVAQRPQQWHVVGDIEVAGLSVDVERDHGVLHCPGSELYHTACATGNPLDDGVGVANRYQRIDRHYRSIDSPPRIWSDRFRISRPPESDMRNDSFSTRDSMTHLEKEPLELDSLKCN